MVLYIKEYNEAKRSNNIRIKVLLQARNAARCYIFQCGCDWAIQKLLKSLKSTEYEFNNDLIHNPQKYLDQGLIKGPGSRIMKKIAPEFEIELKKHLESRRQKELEIIEEEEEEEEEEAPNPNVNVNQLLLQLGNSKTFKVF